MASLSDKCAWRPTSRTIGLDCPDETIQTPKPIYPAIIIPPSSRSFPDHPVRGTDGRPALPAYVVADRLSGSTRAESPEMESPLSTELVGAFRQLTLPSRPASGSQRGSNQPGSVAASRALRRKALALDTSSIVSQATDGARTSWSSAPLSARRRSMPSGPAAFRHLNFQRFRENLWQRGHQLFGNTTRADAFVMPMKLRLPFSTKSTGGGADDDRDIPYVLRSGGRVRVRAVVRSKGHTPIGLTREFDLDTLHSTIPEPSPSPRTPNFERGASLVALAARGSLQAQYSLVAGQTGLSSGASSEAGSSPESARAASSPTLPAFPIRE